MRTAIVTGGNRGIGRAITERLTSMGFNVFSFHQDRRNEGEENEFVTQCIGDVSNESDVENFFSSIRDVPVDILVNNAGVASAKRFEDLTVLDFNEMFRVNVLGVFLMSRAFAKHTPSGSQIINISSVSGLAPFSGHAHYCASKHALTGMAGVMAKELAPKGIRVNNICPSPTKTDMWTELDRQYREAGFVPADAPEDFYLGKQLIKRFGHPDDVAQAVEYLVNSSYITGINLPVCGGNILR